MLNPLIGKTLPANQYEAELVLRRVQVPRARQYIQLFASRPHLSLDDAIGFASLAIGREAQEVLLPRNKAISSELLNRNICISIRVMLEALRAPEPRWRLTVPFGDHFERWNEEIHHCLQRAIARTGSERDQEVAAAMSFVSETCGPPRDLAQFRAMIKRTLRKLEVYPADVKLKEDLVQGFLTLHRRETHGTAGGMFLDNGGRAVLGAHQVRDTLCRALAIQRPRSRSGKDSAEHPVAPQPRMPETLFLEEVKDFRDRRADQAIEAIQAMETIRRQREWVEARQTQLRTGSVEADVLPYLLRFVHGEVRPAHVARETGRAWSAVAKTLGAQAGEMERALKAA